MRGREVRRERGKGRRRDGTTSNKEAGYGPGKPDHIVRSFAREAHNPKIIEPSLALLLPVDVSPILNFVVGTTNTAG